MGLGTDDRKEKSIEYYKKKWIVEALDIPISGLLIIEATVTSKTVRDDSD